MIVKFGIIGLLTTLLSSLLWMMQARFNGCEPDAVFLQQIVQKGLAGQPFGPAFRNSWRRCFRSGCEEQDQDHPPAANRRQARKPDPTIMKSAMMLRRFSALVALVCGGLFAASPVRFELRDT